MTNVSDVSSCAVPCFTSLSSAPSANNIFQLAKSLWQSWMALLIAEDSRSVPDRVGRSHSTVRLVRICSLEGQCFCKKFLHLWVVQHLWVQTNLGAPHGRQEQSEIPCFVARQCPFVSETRFFCLAFTSQPTKK